MNEDLPDNLEINPAHNGESSASKTLADVLIASDTEFKERAGLIVEPWSRLPLFSTSRAMGDKILEDTPGRRVPSRELQIGNMEIEIFPGLVPTDERHPTDPTIRYSKPVFPGAIEGLIHGLILQYIRDLDYGPGAKSVPVSASRIRKDLKRYGKNVNLQRIKEALLVLSGASVKIKGADDTVYHSRMLELVKEKDRYDLPTKRDEEDLHVSKVRNLVNTIFYVRLPTIIERSVEKGRWRPAPISTILRGTPFARWFKTWFASVYTSPARYGRLDLSAGRRNVYRIDAFEFIQASGLFVASEIRFSDNVHSARRTLNALVCPVCKESPINLTKEHDCEVPLAGFSFKGIRKKESTGRGRPGNAKVTLHLYPSRSFIEAQIKSNSALSAHGTPWSRRDKT